MSFTERTKIKKSPKKIEPILIATKVKPIVPKKKAQALQAEEVKPLDVEVEEVKPLDVEAEQDDVEAEELEPDELEPQDRKIKIKLDTSFDRSEFIKSLYPTKNLAISKKIPVIDEEVLVVENPVEAPIPIEAPTLGKKAKKAVTKKAATKPKPEGKTKKIKTETVVKALKELRGIRQPAKKSAAIKIKASSYYLNNRKKFIQFINTLFGKYTVSLKERQETASCEVDEDAPFTTMVHQQIVRDYINTYTPYRGILLYHGLGSGKTCSSIAIAEGMKENKEVIVMTPASLKRNYFEELKKCGDVFYRKNQYWEFVEETDENIESLSQVLYLPLEFIKEKGGAWMTSLDKESNYDELSSSDKKIIQFQIDKMIDMKYKFIAYNGLREQHIDKLSKKNSINPFDNKVIIIDEAHNFVSRIVNKLSKPDSVSMRLYNYLMDATNAKVILLSGTPIINYPNELAVLYNIIRGTTKQYNYKIKVVGPKIDTTYFSKLLNSKTFGGKITDYIDYNPKKSILSITRNPFGFVKSEKNNTSKATGREYAGMSFNETNLMTDEEYGENIRRLLKSKKDIQIVQEDIVNMKLLPDTLEEFKLKFIDTKTNLMKNEDMFKRRILGLTSYFRSAQETLMPRYNKEENFHVVSIEMSDFQFPIYEGARIQERQQSKQNAKKLKKGADEESSSTYRIFSRAYCNFVFPIPDIRRPLPKKEEFMNEDDKEAGNAEEEDINYEKQIEEALQKLEENKEIYFSEEGLSKYSPKFLEILKNIQDPKKIGCHLIYSQFRTLEGIGILKLILETHGYAHFQVMRHDGKWLLNMSDEDLLKPKFILYTGTETTEEKEIFRNIFNGNMKQVPETILKELTATNNMYGEIAKIFMITASGAEGISLKNVRYVHITEPYWHPVRVEQVIGRARRICSHKELPEELRTVDVFLYLMRFSQSQLDDDSSIELRLNDKSKFNLKDKTPITTDYSLFEISEEKTKISESLLTAIKESSFDCILHTSNKNDEKLKCYTFGDSDPDKMSYKPDFNEDDDDTMLQHNKVKEKLKLQEITLKGKKYGLNKETNFVYDGHKTGNPLRVGKLKKNSEEKLYIDFDDV